MLATRYPNHIGHFMSYQKTIIKAHRSFIGEGWIMYDTCYHRKAANNKSLEWGKVDFNLYNETFTGRAKAVSRCVLCSSKLHLSTACPDKPVSANTRNGGLVRRVLQAKEHSGPVCGLFNSYKGNTCTYVCSLL